MRHIAIIALALAALAGSGACAQEMDWIDLECHSPTWSPDGNSVLFVGKTDTGSDLYVVRGERHSLSRLTRNDEPELHPDWAPDGVRVIFVRPTETGSQLCIRNRGGSIDELTDGTYHDTKPAWSPDGRTIAFVSDREGNDDIWLLSLEDASLTQLTGHPAQDTDPAWSPDGKLLVYASECDGVKQLFETTPEGIEPERVLGAYARTPAWSPDGEWLVYSGSDVAQSAYSPLPSSICVTRFGEDTARVLAPGAMGYDPDWSPDGEKLVFARNHRLFIVKNVRELLGQ